MGISDMSNQLLGLQAGGLKSADKQALIDIANTADSSNTSVNTALTNAIGSPTVNGDGYAKIISDLNTQKSNLVTRLASRGVTALATETLKALVDKISNIVYGGVCTANDIRTGKSAVVNGVLTSGTMNLVNLTAGNVKTGIVIDGITGTYSPSVVEAGTVTMYQDTSATAHTGTTIGKRRAISITNISGTFRVFFSIHPNIAGNLAIGRIYKNGVLYGTNRTTTLVGGETFTEDLVFNSGDEIQLYTSSGGAYDNIVYNFGVQLATTIPKYTVVL